MKNPTMEALGRLNSYAPVAGTLAELFASQATLTQVEVEVLLGRPASLLEKLAEMEMFPKSVTIAPGQRGYLTSDLAEWFSTLSGPSDSDEFIDKIELLDAVRQSESFPHTFHLPARNEISNIRPGDYVRLSFQALFGPPERMLVKVTHASKAGYRGQLSNMPAGLFFRERLRYGDSVAFSRRNILEVRKAH